MGDEGGQNDQFDNSQRNNKNFFSAIIRIDVDKQPGSLPPNPHPSVPSDSGVACYAVPPDNPFVYQSLGGPWTGSYNGIPINEPATVRTEFRATGFRKPWQMAFHPVTGELWDRDVGGSYLFSDYESGNVWSLRRIPGGPPTVIRLCGESGITSFDTDPPNGDLPATDYNGRRLLRLVAGKADSGYPHSTKKAAGESLPRRPRSSCPPTPVESADNCAVTPLHERTITRCFHG